MNADMKSMVYGVTGVLAGLVVLDLFGIAEQGSLKIAHRGKLGRDVIHAKDTLMGENTAGLYQ